jgi:hypothetical protein
VNPFVVSTAATVLPGGAVYGHPPGELPAIREADPTRHYVAAFPTPWSSVVYDTLATQASRMVSLHGDDLFDAMEDDGTIAACVELGKAAILGDGVTFNTAVSPRPDDEGEDAAAEVYTDEDAEVAAEMLAYAERAVAAMDADATLDMAMWELLDAIPRGNALGEIVWRVAEDGPDAGFHVLDSIRCKPRANWNFIFDDRGRIAGFAVRGVRQRSDRDPRRNLPRAKCVLFRWNPKAGRPQGTPALQAVYNPWNEKTLLRPEHWKYVATFASPFLFGTSAEGAQPYVDEQGRTISPPEAMLQMLLAMATKKAGAAAHSAEVKLLAPPGEGAAFSGAEGKFRLEIVERLLHMPRSAARMAAGPDDKDSPQDDFTYKVRRAKCWAEKAIRDDVLKPLMRDRYEARYGRHRVDMLTPWPQLGRVDTFLFSRFANAISRLVSVGAIPPSTFPEVMDVIGLTGLVQQRDVRHSVAMQRVQYDTAVAQAELIRAQAASARAPAPAPTTPRPGPG